VALCRWPGMQAQFGLWKAELTNDFQFCVQGVASLTNFLPTVIGNFGFGTINTLLLTAPVRFIQYTLLECGLTFSSAIHCDSTFLSVQQLVLGQNLEAFTSHLVPNSCCHGWNHHLAGDNEHWCSVLRTVPDVARRLWLFPNFECLDGQYRGSASEEASHRHRDE